MLWTWRVSLGFAGSGWREKGELKTIVNKKLGPAAMIFLLIGLSVPVDAAPPNTKTKRVSVRSNGVEALDGDSASPDISANGRFVVFQSSASNLVRNDDNGAPDIFVHDRQTGKTRRISVKSNGQEAEVGGTSSDPDMTPNGRFIVFDSSAENLVPNDDNSAVDVFIHDRNTGKTRRVSVKSNGDQAEVGDSTDPVISDSGKLIAFTSLDEDLVPNDDNAFSDVFLHNRRTGKTRRVSVASNGDQTEEGANYSAAISGNGRVIAFTATGDDLAPNDANTIVDVLVRDLKTKETRLVSLRSNGDQGTGGDSSDPELSFKGLVVAFESHAIDLVPSDGNDAEDIFVHSRITKKTRLVSVNSAGDEGNGSSEDLDMTNNGRFISFESSADNLVAADDNNHEDCFVYDRKTKKMRRISLRNNGNESLVDGSDDPDISAGAKFGAFESGATDLVPNDGNVYRDIFVRGPLR
jgi:Tol biopolymer transport system component